MINLCIWWGKGWTRGKEPRKRGRLFCSEKIQKLCLGIGSYPLHLEDVILHQHEGLFTVIFSEAWLSLNRLLRLRSSLETGIGPMQGKDWLGVLIGVLASWSWQNSHVGVPQWSSLTSAWQFTGGGAEWAVLDTRLTDCHRHNSFSSSRPHGLMYQTREAQAVLRRRAQPFQHG